MLSNNFLSASSSVFEELELLELLELELLDEDELLPDEDELLLWLIPSATSLSLLSTSVLLGL
jgi:hypothetical protein